MTNLRNKKRLELFNEIFAPNKILIEYRRFESFNELVNWCIKKMCELVPNIDPVSIETKAKQSASFLTILENGVFIPHLKIDDIQDFYNIFVVLSTYLYDPEIKKEVRSIFMMLSPVSDEGFKKHLDILSLVSSVLKDDVVKMLSTFKTPDEIYKYLKSCL